MANHYFLNEITNHIGDSSVLVKAILNQVSTYGDAGVEWYVRPDQQQFLTTDSSVFVESNHRDLAERLKNRVVQLSQNGAAGSIFHVFSYDGFVLGAATALNGPDLYVVGHHLAELARAIGHGPQPMGLRSPLPPRSPSATALPFSEAVELAKRVLTQGGHTSPERAMHQKDLRPRMIRLDERARKNPYDPGSAGLIAQIVRVGRKEGWLDQESRGNGQTGYEFVWLIPVGQAGSQTVPQSPSAIDAPATPAVTSAISSHISVPAAPPRADQQMPPISEQGREPSASQKGSSKYSQSLSKQMEDILRSEHIGTHPRTRQRFYDAFRELLEEACGGLALPKLRALSVDKAIAAAGANHSDNDWRTASRCFLSMMIRGGALLNPNEERIVRGPFGLTATAANLDPNYQVRAEAVLLEIIIERRGSIRENELYSAGLAMYQTGATDPTPDYEIETQIANILELLLAEKRIRFDGEKYVKESDQA